ncbi:hypothetical protein AK812_SmicGene43610 [Symbiodinium microadriaticum]|uniref:Uncharacterized protein n=1 Tax=Symbiodinium microadriaticum TaxID=2951 RepID=A0A1Q9C0J9_SYMMI|nr:hypothetical protein AK812_SmicGene43610 [Symbiodinium microadriaticum]
MDEQGQRCLEVETDNACPKLRRPGDTKAMVPQGLAVRMGCAGSTGLLLPGEALAERVLNTLANIDLGLKGQSQPHHHQGGIHPIVRLDTLKDSYTPGASEQHVFSHFQQVVEASTQDASSGGGEGNIGELRWLQLSLARCAEPGARLAHVLGLSDALQHCHTCTVKRTAWAPVTGMMNINGCKFLCPTLAGTDADVIPSRTLEFESLTYEEQWLDSENSPYDKCDPSAADVGARSPIHMPATPAAPLMDQASPEPAQFAGPRAISAGSDRTHVSEQDIGPHEPGDAGPRGQTGCGAMTCYPMGNMMLSMAGLKVRMQDGARQLAACDLEITPRRRGGALLLVTENVTTSSARDAAEHQEHRERLENWAHGRDGAIVPRPGREEANLSTTDSFDLSTTGCTADALVGVRTSGRIAEDLIHNGIAPQASMVARACEVNRKGRHLRMLIAEVSYCSFTAPRKCQSDAYRGWANLTRYGEQKGEVATNAREYYKQHIGCFKAFAARAKMLNTRWLTLAPPVVYTLGERGGGMNAHLQKAHEEPMRFMEHVDLIYAQESMGAGYAAGLGEQRISLVFGMMKAVGVETYWSQGTVREHADKRRKRAAAGASFNPPANTGSGIIKAILGNSLSVNAKSMNCGYPRMLFGSEQRHYQLNAVGRRSNYILVIADFTSIDIVAMAEVAMAEADLEGSTKVLKSRERLLLAHFQDFRVGFMCRPVTVSSLLPKSMACLLSKMSHWSLASLPFAGRMLPRQLGATNASLQVYSSSKEADGKKALRQQLGPANGQRKTALQRLLNCCLPQGERRWHVAFILQALLRFCYLQGRSFAQVRMS